MWGSYFFHLLPYLEQDNLYEARPGPCAITADWTDHDVLSGQQQRLQPAGASLPLPFGSERRSGRRRDGQRDFPGASCYAANALSRHRTTSDPVPAIRRARTASPTFTDGTSNTILYAEKYARSRTPPPRSGTAAVRGRTARSPFVNLPPPMRSTGQTVPRVLRSPLGLRTKPCHRPRVEIPGPAHSVSGQLRSDPGRDGSPRRHAGRPGRWQRPHAGPESERRHLVGRRDALGRRSAGLGLVESRRTV